MQCSDDGQTFRPLTRVTLKPGEETTIAVRGDACKALPQSCSCRRIPIAMERIWNVQVAEIALLSKAQAGGQETTGALPVGSQRSGGCDAVRGRQRATGLGRSRGKLEGPAHRHHAARPRHFVRRLRTGRTGDRHDECRGDGRALRRDGREADRRCGPLAGKTLQYFHIDSWELGQPTWTPKMRDEFTRRRGYDPLPWLPAVLGQTVDNAAETARFLQDYRRTAADLVAANYYGRLRELTIAGGLRGTHPESGGPFFTHWIDALQCEGINDVPMGEFWKRNFEPDGPLSWHPHNNPTVKQVACAAHIYGKPVCQAEAFTSFADDWIDDPWTMKDIGDAAFCEGLTRNVLCFWVHQPRLDAKPGFQWAHVGTHFDCNLTWWPMAEAWLTYLARCQHMLTSGLVRGRLRLPAGRGHSQFHSATLSRQRLAGFDYDVLNAEVLLTRVCGQRRPLDAARWYELPLPRVAAATRCDSFSGDAEEGQRIGRRRRDGDRSRVARRFGDRSCAKVRWTP